MKRHSLRRLRAQLFGQGAAWQIHEPALEALMAWCYAPQAKGEQGAPPAKQVIAERLGMHAADAPTTQMVGQVAVLPIVGVLQQKASWFTRYMGWTATEILERDFKAAIADSQVKAIVLYCDSPGGTALGNEEVARTFLASRDKKPVVAFVRGLCASACYYLASAASKIVASPSSTIGSIGTIWVHAEYSKMFAAAGIGVSVLRHGANKGIGNQYEPLKPEAREKLQAWIDGYGNQFEAAVAKGRGISAADVRAKYGQGDAFLADEAKKRGMVDAVSSWEQVLAGLSAGSSAPLPQPGQIQSHAEARGHGGVSGSVADGHLALCASVPLCDVSAMGASPAAVVPLPPAAAGPEHSMKVSARVRAALFARGFISAQDCDDALCLVALSVYFSARGEACPQEDDKVLAGLMATPAKPDAALQAAGATNFIEGKNNIQAAHEKEMAEAKAEGAKNEAGRQKSIRASGELLKLSAVQIESSIAGGKPHAEVVAAWHTELSSQEKPIGQSINVGADGSERFAADATLALLSRLDRVPQAQASQVTDQVRRLSNAPLSYFAQQSLLAAGVKADFDFMPKEELFEMAFAMDGNNRFTLGSSYAAYNRPGSFPNLLSNLANKILDAALELAATTYQEWTGMWPGDLPDFKPAPVAAKGQADEMDEILDGEASKEFGLAEEMLSYMVLRRYSNVFKWTPAMAANDDLGAFDEGLLGLEMAWQNTVNRLCLSQLTGNVTLLDTFPLFDDTNHGNDVTAGTAPSVAAWETMNLKVMAQRGIGGTGYIRTPLALALVPPAHYITALQVFAPLQLLGELKRPSTDTGINPYRGAATVIQEPELQGSSNDIWYGLCRPRGMVNATVIRAYFRGWGKNGRRQRWYDPETKCWHFELEGRVGAATKQYRTIVRNDGVT